MLRLRLACALAAAFARPAHAAEARPGAIAAARDCDAASWQVGRGELIADRACGAFLLATDASDHDESLGEASFAREVRLPLEVAVTWRRLGPEAGQPIWLKLPGAHLLFKDGAVGLWVNRAQFAASGWRKLPGMAIHDEHRISVRQTRTAVELSLDGKRAATLPLAAPPGAGKVAIGLNGARGYRSLLAFRGFSVRAASQ